MDISPQDVKDMIVLQIICNYSTDEDEMKEFQNIIDQIFFLYNKQRYKICIYRK